jgi:hypothetical protein
LAIRAIQRVPPLTKAEWRIVILGIPLGIVAFLALVGIYIGGLLLADAI